MEIVDIASKLVHEQSDVSEPTCNASDVACERCNEDLVSYITSLFLIRTMFASSSMFMPFFY